MDSSDFFLATFPAWDFFNRAQTAGLYGISLQKSIWDPPNNELLVCK